MLTTEEMTENLNKLYWQDAEMYQRTLDHYKESGYKVMRNSKGQHKVEHVLSSAFGGVFKEIFNL